MADTGHRHRVRRTQHDDSGLAPSTPSSLATLVENTRDEHAESVRSHHPDWRTVAYGPVTKLGAGHSSNLAHTSVRLGTTPMSRPVGVRNRVASARLRFPSLTVLAAEIVRL